MEWVYRPVVVAIKSALRVLGWRMLVSGEEHIPATGPAVLVCNHVSYLDPVLIGYAADRRGRLIRFLAKRELFDVPVFGRMLRQMRHIPVERGRAGGRALGAAVTSLGEGNVIGMFPEETISVAFVPAAGKSGAARMAMEAGAPLVPAALWGGQRLVTKHRPRNLRRNVALMVRVGAPIAYSPDEDAAVVTKRLMSRITELVEEAAAVYPHQPEGPDDRWWLPRHLGGTAPTVEEAAELRRREAVQRRARRSAQRAEGEGRGTAEAEDAG